MKYKTPTNLSITELIASIAVGFVNIPAGVATLLVFVALNLMLTEVVHEMRSKKIYRGD